MNIPPFWVPNEKISPKGLNISRGVAKGDIQARGRYFRVRDEKRVGYSHYLTPGCSNFYPKMIKTWIFGFCTETIGLTKWKLNLFYVKMDRIFGFSMCQNICFCSIEEKIGAFLTILGHFLGFKALAKYWFYVLKIFHLWSKRLQDIEKYLRGT